MIIKEYDRESAVNYARKWAFSRNPLYYDFENIGGDCTNFVSQCLFGGGAVMNYTPETGWYYNSLSSRAPAWTGVEQLFAFLTKNDGVGPFAEETDIYGLQIGDIVQLGRETGDFYHSPFVCCFSGSVPLVAAHTFDAYGVPLYNYRFERLRCIHVSGVRTD